jgi:hypothetical protein
MIFVIRRYALYQKLFRLFGDLFSSFSHEKLPGKDFDTLWHPIQPKVKINTASG